MPPQSPQVTHGAMLERRTVASSSMSMLSPPRAESCSGCTAAEQERSPVVTAVGGEVCGGYAFLWSDRVKTEDSSGFVRALHLNGRLFSSKFGNFPQNFDFVLTRFI